MSTSHYERMSALDAAFLALEDGDAHMHIGSVALFDAGPLAKAEGGIDFDRIVSHVEAALPLGDRMRQKLVRVPVLKQPVWVDDPSFNLHYHLRHASLPAPGDERQLKRLVGRLMSEGLDRGKPLWELWVVEGLTDHRFAVISKIHHSLADGIASVGLLTAGLRPQVRAATKSRRTNGARPVPSGPELLRDELWRRAQLPLALARAGAGALLHPRRAASDVRDAAAGVAEAVWSGIRPASQTPLNQPLGPHRRFDWTRIDLDQVDRARRRFGGTVNDVVLSVVAGAVRRFLTARGFRVQGLDFRALVPVSVPRESRRRRLGNRVAVLLVPLPIDERRPGSRLTRISETTRALKQSRRRQGVEALEALADWTLNGLVSQVAHFGLQHRVGNLVVTNVPGPPEPLELLGARMLAAYPLVPLGRHQSLGVAVFSYAGEIFWGCSADWDALPDLHAFVQAIEAEFAALCAATDTPGTGPARRRARAVAGRRRG